LKRPPLQLYLYNVVLKTNADASLSFPLLDLGFSIYLDIKKIYPKLSLEKFPSNTVLEFFKDDLTYSFNKSSSTRLLHTYKAYLEKVVDGDTLIVNIDLGFSLFSEQILRLRGLDAPEIETKEGIASKKFLETTLSDVKFLLIKTYSRDMYDRKLVDVFYLPNEEDEETVIQRGIFLNREILEKGFGERM
jgi:endonuclease YncB( thermonuclease family)